MDFGLSTAVKGLLASQRSLYITSHNIANSNTKGYTRQEGAQRATTPFNIPGMGFLGSGTEIYNVIRIRDAYVDIKYWNESASMGEWSVKMDILTEIEKLFGEPSDSSFRQYLDDFYKSLEDMSKNPANMSYREPVRENALAFTKHINGVAQRLIELRREVGFAIDARVESVNSLASQIAILNRQIYANELEGRHANDLRDKRDLLIDELSKIVNIRVHESDDGKYRVSIGGVTLVDHLDVSLLKAEEDPSNGNIVIKWGNGSEAEVHGGELKGFLDLYNGDGNSNSYRGIKYYQNRLDEFAAGFAKGFNEIHRLGYTLSDNGYGVTSGINFFAGSGNDPDNIRAINITISDEIMDDLRNIAAASNPEGSPEDNGNLLNLISQRNTGVGFGFNSTPDDFIKSIMSNYAVDSIQSKRMHETQNLILKNIESKRSSISGVSYDEEMANMVKYQQAYIASARMINTLDEIMDLVVNNLGLFGR